MKRENLLSAATKTIRHSTTRIGVGIGLLTLDRNGRYGVDHNTRNLCWAAKTVDGSKAKMSGKRVGSQLLGRLLSSHRFARTQFSHDQNSLAHYCERGMG